MEEVPRSASDPIFGVKSQRLNFEYGEIRLVSLKPGEWDDGISCELTVAALHEKPRFIAISYFWGRTAENQSKLPEILVNDQKLEIPINLFTGLKRIRSSTEEVILWADAICINQNDQIELIDQVARMTQLYRQCEEVRVFLDDDTAGNGPSHPPEPYVWTLDPSRDGRFVLEDDDKNFRASHVTKVFLAYNQVPKAMRHKSDGDPALGVFYLLSRLARNKHFNVDHIQLLVAQRTRYHILSKLHEIMSLPWWRRQWIVQEAVFAQKLTLQYKGFVCPWEMFGNASTHYREHIQTCCSSQYAELPPNDLEALELFTHAVNDLDYWRRVWGRDECGGAKNRRVDLLQLLRQFRTRQTSIPKDKVYALLPLVTHWDREDPIRIIYSFSDAAVFREVVDKMISISGNLSVLMGNTGTLTRSAEDHRVSSWVTDWATQPDPGELERLLRASFYNASGKGMPSWRILVGTEDDSCLELEGFARDVISSAAEVMPHQDEGDISAKFEEWEAFLELHMDPDRVYRNGTEMREAYWRTICMDTICEDQQGDNHIPLLERQAHRPVDVTDHTYSDWMETLRKLTKKDVEMVNGSRAASVDGDSSNGDDSDYQSERDRMTVYQVQVDEAISSATAHRRLFQTRDGYIGLGPARMEVGDEIWILKGGSMPFLLRPAGEYEFKRVSGGKRHCYRLVGECYVHGLMYGEAVEDRNQRMEPVWLV